MNKYKTLTPGVKLYIGQDSEVSQRIYINRGILPATESIYHEDIKYLPNAFKPLPDWYEACTEDLDLLLTDSPDIPYSECVCLFKIPEKAIKIFRESGLSECNSHETVLERLKADKTRLQWLDKWLGEFATLLRHEGIEKGKARIHGFFSGRANVETVAYDSDKQYFGLHIDNSQGNTIYNTDKAPNRICINIGKEDRFLLFVNKTVRDIYNLLVEKNVIRANDKIPEGKLCRLFFENYPDYPVIKIRQKPYEAYMAPTDNLIHDGSTSGTMNPDVTVVLLGYFGILNVHNNGEIAGVTAL